MDIEFILDKIKEYGSQDDDVGWECDGSVGSGGDCSGWTWGWERGALWRWLCFIFKKSRSKSAGGGVGSSSERSMPQCWKRKRVTF